MRLCFATKAEKSRALPGDKIVESPGIQSTHAITITARCEEVWPWIVQIGQGRGGFDSYTFLENLLGCKMKNASQIHDHWQSLSTGDSILIHPRMRPLKVEQMIHNCHLVLAQRNANFTWTWSFVLLETNDKESRLLARTRLESESTFESLLLYPIMTVGHYWMERKMLCGIKQRSESRMCKD